MLAVRSLVSDVTAPGAAPALRRPAGQRRRWAPYAPGPILLQANRALSCRFLWLDLLVLLEGTGSPRGTFTSTTGGRGEVSTCRRKISRSVEWPTGPGDGGRTGRRRGPGASPGTGKTLNNIYRGVARGSVKR